MCSPRRKHVVRRLPNSRALTPRPETISECFRIHLRDNRDRGAPGHGRRGHAYVFVSVGQLLELRLPNWSGSRHDARPAITSARRWRLRHACGCRSARPRRRGQGYMFEDTAGTWTQAAEVAGSGHDFGRQLRRRGRHVGLSCGDRCALVTSARAVPTSSASNQAAVMDPIGGTPGRLRQCNRRSLRDRGCDLGHAAIVGGPGHAGPASRRCSVPNETRCRRAAATRVRRHPLPSARVQP